MSSSSAKPTFRTKPENKQVNLPTVIGQGYGEFWRSRHRYRIVKGSRASKKSKTTALWYLINMMKYPEANLLVVRKTFRTLKDSCFTELKWAANRLQVSHLWNFKASPLQATYKPTGQQIFFRGLDDPLKITSITTESGNLCWLWIEEAYEITRESDFDTLNESIRGQAPPGLWKQTTLIFNPWNEHHWLKKRFFDTPDSDTLTLTVDYTINEFLDEADFHAFERMKQHNPRRYQVAGLGHWGVVEGLIYERWEEKDFELKQIMEEQPEGQTIFGLDFGYTNDPSALFCGYMTNDKIYVFDEIYRKAMTNEAIAEALEEEGYSKELIIADSAEPKSIDRLRTLGIRKITAATKGPGSVSAGIDLVQDHELVIHPRCVNFLTEIANYGWKIDKQGNKTNEPDPTAEDHLMDAMRYAVAGAARPRAQAKLMRGLI